MSDPDSQLAERVFIAAMALMLLIAFGRCVLQSGGA